MVKIPKVGSLAKTATSVLVQMPKVFGGFAGLIIRPYQNWVSPVEGLWNAIKGLATGSTTQYQIDNIQRGFSSGVLSYTGYRTDTNKMDFDHAVGAKAGIIGIIVSEVAKWLLE